MIPVYSQPLYSYPSGIWPVWGELASHQILEFASEIRNEIYIESEIRNELRIKSEIKSIIKLGANMSLIDYFYDGQNAVQMRAYNLGDLSTAGTCLIKYKKPDLTTGSWTATIDTENDGEIYYDLLNTEFLTVGTWTFWTHITYTDGRIGIGDPKTITIREEGQ